ncbi:MAG: hypothetical protein ACJA2Q_000810 [Pseudohongiellaceae bacterium]|jgi:hypothetical protein
MPVIRNSENRLRDSGGDIVISYVALKRKNSILKDLIHKSIGRNNMRSLTYQNFPSCLALLMLTFLSCMANGAESAIEVNVLNYVRAKTTTHFDGVVARAGGINKWGHVREPIPLDRQRSRRMNRDTLYSSVVVDISKGATFSMPDAGDRYMSATVINQDHFINKIFHGAGHFSLDIEEFDTPYVLLTVRILANSEEPSDIAIANQLQDALTIESASSNPYVHQNYDLDSLSAVGVPLIELAAGLPNVIETFGRKEVVNNVRHLLATAYGWGGLPEYEAFYVNVQPDLPVASYSLTVKDVPVDGFWSLSVYNKEGYFQENVHDAYSVNNLTATANENGSYTVHFGGDPIGDNYLPITEGWNFVMRMYQPQETVIDGSWIMPDLVKVD